MVSLQARKNHEIWAAARALDAVRRTDRAVERSWQDRLRHRLEGCRGIMRHVKRDGNLRSEMDVETAADLLWTMTSLRMWEDLVLSRRWSAAKYEQWVYEALLRSLTNRAPESS